MNQNRSFCQIISGFHLCRGIPEITEHNQLFLSQISLISKNIRIFFLNQTEIPINKSVIFPTQRN